MAGVDLPTVAEILGHRDIKMTMHEVCKSPKAKQTGILLVTLPLRYEEAEAIAFRIAKLVAEQLSFQFGEFKLHGGMIICTRIPETPEEQTEIGDKPHAITMHLEEVVPLPSFNPKDFLGVSKAGLDMGLVSQHNVAKKAQSPADKLLGFFKILESQFTTKANKQSLAEQLENNKKLFTVYATTFKNDSMEPARHSFKKFIREIVRARHRCAHLKANNSFGYVPTDVKIREEVIPLLVRLEILTRETIIKEGDSP